jgi:uncharacterized protein YcbK (DUF882 family)
MNRRDFLGGSAKAALACALPFSAQALASGVDPNWRAKLLSQPRTLWLTRGTTGEQIQSTYWTPGDGYLRSGYGDACLLLRDVKANRAAYMDPWLLDVLFGVQAWLGHYGYRQPIIINSGFRTATTNDRLEGASRNSKHLSGQAADIRIPGVPESTLGAMAVMFTNGGQSGIGGVGFYPSRGFVHVDTGQARTWGQGAPKLWG